MAILHFILCGLLCSCGFLVSTAVNPIEGVLFLILAFFNAAAILFLFHAEFLGLVFIIVYVGAIAILFLFVIMMLNIKINNNRSVFDLINSNFLFVIFALISLLLSPYLIFSNVFNAEDLFILQQNTNPFLLIDSLNNIDIMGQALFNYYLVAFLLAGIILLIALVGAIVLTLRFNHSETSQLVNRQLARTDNTLSFFKTKI
jgi:NADH-quinone oxidoreductase subunit J